MYVQNHGKSSVRAICTVESKGICKEEVRGNYAPV